MKFEYTVTKTEEFDAKYLVVEAFVRYWEDATINGKPAAEDGSNVPCRSFDMWILRIEVDTGKILNWPIGTTADIHFKVCDAGEYFLDDPNYNTLKYKRAYVPDFLSPGGYGDYIIMKINENGYIENWNIEINPDEWIKYGDF